MRVMVVSSVPPRFGRRNPDGSPALEWADLAAVVQPTHEAYCARHGYGYKMDESDVWDKVGSPWIDQKPSVDSAPIRHFNKLRLMQHYMTPEKCRREYDWVVWLDADLVIGDYDTPLTKWMNQGRASTGVEEPMLGDLIIPFDPNTVHPTVIMMRSTTLMRGLVWAMTEAGQRMYHQHDWSEHLAFKFFVQWQPYAGVLWQHSAKVLCAMSPGIYPMPPDVRASYEYEEGVSWSLHLSALPIAKRIELAQAFIAEHPIPCA